MVLGAGRVIVHAHCPQEDACAVPDDFDGLERCDFLDRITSVRSFMLERDNMPRTIDNLVRMRQRLFREGFCIVAYETGELVGIAGSDIHIGITGAALYLQQVLESDNYSHLTKIPICLGVQIEIWRAEELELAAASQESIDVTEFGAIPAAREAIDTLERTKPDKSPSEGYEAEPCSICLEEMKVLDVEAARMPCKHVFHYDCIARWLNTSHLCPLCRFSMPTAHVSQFQTT